MPCTVFCLCFHVPAGSLLLCYVILPSSAWSPSWFLPSPWLPLCAAFGPSVVSRLAGIVVKASTSGAEYLGFKSCLRWDFSGSSHTSDLKIGTPVATLPGAWRYRVSAGTGQPGVSMLWLGEMESLICNFYLSVAARKIEQIHPWDTLACFWDVKQPTNKQTLLISSLSLVATLCSI